jgi:hypothetical protein
VGQHEEGAARGGTGHCVRRLHRVLGHQRGRRIGDAADDARLLGSMPCNLFETSADTSDFGCAFLVIWSFQVRPLLINALVLRALL